MHKRVRHILGAAALLLAAPALAQVEAKVAASNLRYLLTDLRPGDGQAPAASFTQGRHVVGTNLIVFDENFQELYRESTSLAAPRDVATALAWNGVLRSEARLEPGASFDMAGGAAASIVRPDQAQTRYGYASAQSVQDYRLAPYTSLTVSLDYDIALLIAPDAGAGARQYGSGAADLVGYGYFSADPLDRQLAYDGGFQMVVHDEYTDRLEAHEGGTLTITLANTTDAWGEGYFFFELGATSNVWPLSPVPEPGERGMLGAGLALLAALGLLERRRRRQVRTGAPQPSARRPFGWWRRSGMPCRRGPAGHCRVAYG